jgi:hypothetical protein
LDQEISDLAGCGVADDLGTFHVTR